MNYNESELAEELNAVPRSIEYNLSCIKVQGEATLLLWGDDIGTIDMKPYFIPIEKATTSERLIQEVKAGANDAQFGCQRIMKILVNLYPCYAREYSFMDDTLYDSPIAEDLEIELD